MPERSCRSHEGENAVPVEDPRPSASGVCVGAGLDELLAEADEDRTAFVKKAGSPHWWRGPGTQGIFAKQADLFVPFSGFLKARNT